MINVCFIVNNSYVDFLFVSMNSIIANTKSCIDFFIFEYDITEENKKMLEYFINGFNNLTITFIHNDLSQFKNLNSGWFKNNLIYLKYIIPDKLINVEKAIYLDVDIIFNSDIKDFFNINLNNYIIGAIKDGGGEFTLHKKNLNIPSNHNYFNAGLLLVDCKKWRYFSITSKLLDLSEKYKNLLVFQEQDVMNIYFANNYFSISNNYNFFSHIRKKEINKILSIHFVNKKPWEEENAPLDYLWWEYARETPIYERLLYNLKKRINKRNTIRKIGKLKRIINILTFGLIFKSKVPINNKIFE